MKANEAPEKIWVHELSAKELNVPMKEYHVEYIRTDAFIEKVSAWIKKMFSETDQRFNQDYTGMLINDFKETIKQ